MRIRRSTLLGLGLLLLNFPAAFFAMLVAFSVGDELTVTICNSSSEDLHDITVGGGGVFAEKARLRSGERWEFDSKISGDGVLYFQASSPPHAYNQAISDYITNSYAGEVLVIVGEDGLVLSHEDIDFWPN